MIRTKSIQELTAREYKLPPGTVSVELSCGHTGLFVRPVPRTGDYVYCRKCRDYATRSDRRPGRRLHQVAARAELSSGCPCNRVCVPWTTPSRAGSGNRRRARPTSYLT